MKYGLWIAILIIAVIALVLWFQHARRMEEMERTRVNIESLDSSREATRLLQEEQDRTRQREEQRISNEQMRSKQATEELNRRLEEINRQTEEQIRRDTMSR